MENVIVIAVVAVALGWGVTSVVRAVRRVKAAGEGPVNDGGACATGERTGTKLTPGCGCAASGSCPVAESCSVPEPAEATGGNRKTD